MSSILYFDENRVKSLLNWQDTFEAVERALSSTKNGNSTQTPRSLTKCINNSNDVLLTMPGHLKDVKYGALACKLVTSFENNNKRNLPNIIANILLFDDETGELKAVKINMVLTILKC